MEQVSREIVELNNQGVMAARSGDLRDRSNCSSRRRTRCRACNS